MKDRWHSFHKLVQYQSSNHAYLPSLWAKLKSLKFIRSFTASSKIWPWIESWQDAVFGYFSKIKWKSAKFWLHRWHFGPILLEGERECIVLEDECMTWPTVCAGSRITDCKLLSAGMSYAQRSLCRMSMIVADKSHPANGLFSCMPSGIKYRHIQSPLWHIRTECWMSLLGLCI